MNAALITAGGIGVRTGLEIPKQFVVVDDKPIIIYTLEAFEKHSEIDLICVVCLKGWEDRLRNYAKEFGISKLKVIAQGGKSGFDSINNGLKALKEYLKENDKVMVHDSIRPLVSKEIISDNLRICEKYGNAITIIPSVEALLISQNEISSKDSINRDKIKRTQTPQCLMYGEFLESYSIAKKKGILDSIAPVSLLIELGKEVYFSKGSDSNIKITTAQDIEIFKALLYQQKSHFKSYQELCVNGNKKLVEYNLSILTWGNFSLRIPGTDLICIKPSGVSYDKLEAQNIPIVRLSGEIVSGELKPSVDLATHLEIYKTNEKITNIAHTHSTYATAFAQSLKEIPILGSTHADFYNGSIPLSRELRKDEVESDYEKNTGVAINEYLDSIKEPLPAILVPYHAPFIFGYKTLDACENALILEEIAKSSFLSLSLNSNIKKIPSYLVTKHYMRKISYYGQKNSVKNTHGGGGEIFNIFILYILLYKSCFL